MGRLLADTEIKIAVAFTIFAIIWIAWIIPFLTNNPTIQGMNPLAMFLVKKLGYIILSITIIGTIISILVNKSFNIVSASISGILAYLFITFTYSLVEQQSAISIDGTTNFSSYSFDTINPDQVLYYIISVLFPSLLNVSIPILNISLMWIIIYIIIPVVTVLLGALIMKTGTFRNLTRVERGLLK